MSNVATSNANLFDLNKGRYDDIMAEYEAEAPAAVKDFPAMLTPGDRGIYFWAAKHFAFDGTIVDAGCFVGGTTTALLQGLFKNPLLNQNKDKTKGLIRVYDLFRIDDDYILDHLHRNYPDRPFQTSASFLPVFLKNIGPYKEYLDVRPGDVIEAGYDDKEDISLFGVDILKAPPVTDFVVRTFFPRLKVGALVIQQDFIHEFHPHIHLSMLKLEDHFEKFVETEWGGSVAYKLTRRITPDIIRERFGSDLSWYDNVDVNVAQLRKLADEMLFDYNRWVLLLTLAMYLTSHAKDEEARKTYQIARSTYPQFEPHEVTAGMFGEKK